jgi:7-carboxy-7-deazaguanine synthase
MKSQLLVSEIFRSIQGESTRAGVPCTFVRLAGCDRACRWCDTAYARSGGTSMTSEEILNRVRELGTDLVEVTGGEPLHQEAAPHLLMLLADTGATVLLETGGHHDIAALDPRVVRILDLKCPSSGESESNLLSNIRHLRSTDEVKMVIAGRSDYDWARSLVRRHSISDICPVVFSPVYGELDPADLSGWMLADDLPVRLGLQIHKYIWGPEKRGV